MSFDEEQFSWTEDGSPQDESVAPGLPGETAPAQTSGICRVSKDGGDLGAGGSSEWGSVVFEPGAILRIAVGVEGGLVFLATAAGWLVGHSVWTKIHWNLFDALGAVLVTAPLLIGLWLGVNYPWGPWRGLVRVLAEFVVPIFARCRVWHLGIISLLAGLGEEMLFRGLMQDGLADGLAHWLALGEPIGVCLAVALTSAVFGLLHWISPFYALLAGLIGAYLGWWRIHSGNLLGPILTHALYDFAALVYLSKLWRPR